MEEKSRNTSKKSYLNIDFFLNSPEFKSSNKQPKSSPKSDVDAAHYDIALNYNLEGKDYHVAGTIAVLRKYGLPYDDEICGASPSDLRNIGDFFRMDPRYSMYQLFLLFFSGFLIWALLVWFDIVLAYPYDILYYVFVGIGYYVLKYSFRGIRGVFYGITTRNKPPSRRIKHKRYRRKRFKPSKPSKLGKREAPW